MKRRTFLRALAGGTVAALLGVQHRQLGEAESTGWSPGWGDGAPRRAQNSMARTFTICWADGVDTRLLSRWATPGAALADGEHLDGRDLTFEPSS